MYARSVCFVHHKTISEVCINPSAQYVMSHSRCLNINPIFKISIASYKLMNIQKKIDLLRGVQFSEVSLLTYLPFEIRAEGIQCPLL